MKDSGDKISVIVPVYKVEPYLRKCLDSIVNQTYRNLEIILVDDGSPDNCGAICDEYAAKDNRITVIHKENGGVSSARNAGLDKASGDWIGWVDSDDWIELDMYEYLLKNAVEYRADIAVCSRYEIKEDGAIYYGWKVPTSLNREEGLRCLLENNLLQNYCCDKLWRKELWQGVVFPEGKTFEDMAVLHHPFERADAVICLPEPKYNYYQRKGSIVHDLALENRMNHYLAAKLRYDEMREAWPQLEPLLLNQCAMSAIGIWCSFHEAPKIVRQKMRPTLQKISEFCGGVAKQAQENLGLGLAGRLVLKLIRYPTWWSFQLAALISRLYERKHGQAL